MRSAFSAEQIRAGEAPLLTAGAPLMDRAAFALSLEVRKLLRQNHKVRGSRAVLLVGAGNNGGDTLFAGAYLVRAGVQVTAVLCADQVHPKGLAALHAAGGSALTLAQANFPKLLAGAQVVLDGLVGIGSHGALRGALAQAVTQVQAAWAELSAISRPRTVAVDVPSGIGVDDGGLPGPVLPADLTVTFGAAKPGLLLPPAALLAGEVRVIDIGINLSNPHWQRLSLPDLAGLLHPATPSDHKYRRGVVDLVVGSPQYPGAGMLAVAGALRAGSGAVRFCGPAELQGLLVARHPEVLLGPGSHDALVIGSGVPADLAPPLHEEYLRRAGEAVRAGLPVVLDAGGLQLVPALLDRAPATQLPSNVVLTPHGGELSALLQKLDPALPVDPIAAPAPAAAALHHLTGATVVLKGAITVVHGPTRWAQGPNNSWLATAGSGDVLAGLLGGLLATAERRSRDGAPATDPAQLAAAAVLLHSQASVLANPGGPVTASMIAQGLPAAWAEALGMATP